MARNLGYILTLLGLILASAAIVFVVNAPKWLSPVTTRPAVAPATAQPPR